MNKPHSLQASGNVLQSLSRRARSFRSPCNARLAVCACCADCIITLYTTVIVPCTTFEASSFEGIECRCSMVEHEIEAHRGCQSLVHAAKRLDFLSYSWESLIW